jgi:hypothetical protein
MGFRRELLAHRRGIHQRKGIPPGITSSFRLIQTGKIKSKDQNSRISSSKSSKLPMRSLLKFKYENPNKMKNKPDVALELYYLANLIKIRTAKSRENIPLKE